MDCPHVQEIVESMAAGESASVEASAHISTCADCAAALALARRIDDLLRVREAPAAPAHFGNKVLARVRRERWRSEQYLDYGFNAALISAAAMLVVGVGVLMNLTGFTLVLATTTSLLASGLDLLLQRLAGAAATYLAAAGLLALGAGVWWWSEQRFTL